MPERDEQPVEERARQSALADWEQEKARYVLVGYIATDTPLLNPRPGGSPFYSASLGCEASDENQRFCAAYNKVIASLLTEQGVPGWAPLARLPSRQAVLNMLKEKGQTLDNLNLERPPYEQRLFDSLLGRWQIGKGRNKEKPKPSLWCREQEKALLVVGGDWSAKAGRIEVLDVNQMQWMASYEFLRKHVSHFPWDPDKAEEGER